MEKLYEQYGRLMIQKEILDRRILEIKKQIINGVNKSLDEKNKKKPLEQ